jgi:hypothetical protein
MNECKAIRSIVPLLSIRRNYNAQLGNVGFVEDFKGNEGAVGKIQSREEQEGKDILSIGAALG